MLRRRLNALTTAANTRQETRTHLLWWLLAKRKGKAPQPPRRREADLRDLEERLARRLGTRVAVKPGKKKGTGQITIPYRSLDDLDRLLALLEGAR